VDDEATWTMLHQLKEDLERVLSLISGDPARAQSELRATIAQLGGWLGPAIP